MDDQRRNSTERCTSLRAKPRLSILLLAIALAALAVGACGGSGGGADTTAPEITLTSHADGDAVTGSRTITVSGTLSDAGTIAEVTATLNGSAIPGDITFDQTSFSFSLDLVYNTNALEISASDDAGNTGSATAALTYPIVNFTTGQDAALVIFQGDFISMTPGSTDSLVDTPFANPLVVGDKLFVPDNSNNRVLGFNAIPAADNTPADFAVGQPDLTTNSSGNSAVESWGPAGVGSDGTRLFIAERAGNRVLIFNSIPATSGAAADFVVGQTGFGSSDSGCSVSEMNGPSAVTVVGGKLIVADSNNNRVLIFNSIPTANGATPDLVLGQQNFIFCRENDRDGDDVSDTPSASTMWGPLSVWSDGARLVVGELVNNRVLIWNTFPTVNGQPSDVVVGQADFTTVTANTGGIGAATMSGPFASSNGNQLFVGDQQNYRVLIWYSFPTANGAAADVVLGQADFNSGAFGGVTVNTFNVPTGVQPVGNQIFVVDTGNHRVLMFQGN